MDAPCCDRLLEGVLVEPRDYQRRVVGRVIEMFSGPHVDRKAELPEARSVIVESPTGSGKTVMGLLVARWAQEQLGMRVVWAAMRRNLLSQANRENLARGFGVNLQTVSMFDKNPPRGDLLVVDEAQHDATTSMASLHAAVAPAKVLGLSATPWRADRLGLCFERTVRDAGIRQLVLEGYLSPFAHYTIPEWSPAAVAETWLREPARWGRSLIFFRTLAECRACAAVLAAAGEACEIVTGSSDRDAQIERFERGKVRVMIGAAVLTEGFDCPTLQTVFCRPAGKGPTVQMAGRVLRRAEGIAVKNVVQCGQTRHPFTATAPPVTQFVRMNERADEGWRSIGLNDRVEEMTSSMLELLVQMSQASRGGADKRRGRGDDRGTVRGPRTVKPWNFRLEEARDRFRRKRAHTDTTHTEATAEAVTEN
jgi:hypothetical protein